MTPDVRKVLEAMRAEYEGLPYQDIVSLHWRELAPTRITGKKYYPAVWAQTFPEKTALLVVQLTKWYWFKWFGATDCIGFTLTPDGHKEFVDERWLMDEVGHP